MPVDPAIAQLLTLLDSMNLPPMSAGTAEAARAAFRTFTVEMRTPESVVPVSATEDVQVDGATGPLAARVYRPEASGPLPTLVFFHGGGFVIGDLDTHDNQCRWICREAGVVVLSVDYRLAPEARFPAAAEDCMAATRWAAAHLETLGDDAGRLAVGGDSAGGNLAAVVAQLSRDTSGPPLAAQLLLYPATDFQDHEDNTYPSREENAEGFFLTADDMRWFGENYTGDADPTNPRLSPLFGPLQGLPPAIVATAEFDPLRDEGEAYAHALETAAVPVIAHRFDGLIHGFFDMAALSPACAQAVRTTCADLRGLLHA